MISAIAAKEGRIVVIGDIGSAYLNAPMPSESDVFGVLDKRVAQAFCRLYPRYLPFLRTDGTLIVKLRKAVYGCIESAKLWFNHMSGTLRELGFVSNPIQPCTFNKFETNQITVGLFVDDFKVTCVDQNIIDNFLEQLTSRYGPLKISRGSIHFFLGMLFDYSVKGQVKVSMDGYTKDLLRITGVTAKVTTPATAKLFVIDKEAPPLDAHRKSVFHSITAKLLYLAKRVRPEILVATIFLTTRVQNPTEEDSNKLQRVLGYLNSEPALGILLKPDKLTQITVYVDASYGAHSDYKGHTGGVVTFGVGSGPIQTKSVKQKIMSKSSAESELIALSDYAPHGIAAREFMKGQGYVMEPLDIRQDNMSTIALIKRGYPHSDKSRHINIRYFFLKDLIERKEVQITYTPSSTMVADILTKPLQGSLFRRIRDILLSGQSFLES